MILLIIHQIMNCLMKNCMPQKIWKNPIDFLTKVLDEKIITDKTL